MTRILAALSLLAIPAAASADPLHSHRTLAETLDAYCNEDSPKEHGQYSGQCVLGSDNFGLMAPGVCVILNTESPHYAMGEFCTGVGGKAGGLGFSMDEDPLSAVQSSTRDESTSTPTATEPQSLLDDSAKAR